MSDADARVRRQYEALPYPARDPREEDKRLVEGSPSHLLEIDQHLFGGRRDFRQPFRALVAGGGTGDGTIMLAQQLADRGCPAEVVYLDLSEASRRIAEARASRRRLGNLRFLTGSLLDLPTLGLGRFDYIDCCGVLHHLEDPTAGLAALEGALAPGGGIGLMVYGALGRAGVYEAQAMLRQLGAGTEQPAAAVGLARRLLKQLPATNLLARNPAVGDHLRGDDAGLFDLLLHARDRAYTVPQLAAPVEGAGLEIAALIEPWRYDPASYLNDAVLLKRLEGQPPLARAAFAELLAGNLKAHICYLARRGAAMAPPSPEEPAAVPVLRTGDGLAMAARLKPGQSMMARADGIEVRFPLPQRAGPILALIDGARSIGEIQCQVEKSAGIPAHQAAADFQALYRIFAGLNRMFLRLPPQN